MNLVCADSREVATREGGTLVRPELGKTERSRLNFLSAMGISSGGNRIRKCEIIELGLAKIPLASYRMAKKMLLWAAEVEAQSFELGPIVFQQLSGKTVLFALES